MAMDSRALADSLVYPYLNHAASMYEERYATATDIDNGMRFGCGLPVGPLALIEQIGAEQVRDALAATYAETSDPLHQPRPVFDTLGEAQSDEAGTDEAATPRTIETVGVVGSGTMATGIVEVFAKAGYPVTYVARTQDKVDGVYAAIEKSLAKAVSRGKMEQGDADAVLGRLTGATEREALGDVDLVVEAIAEDLEIKTEFYKDLDRICKPGAILATTTSSLSITDLGRVTSRPQDVVGMHFFNPAPIMKLVEVIHTEDTGADVLATVMDLCASVGKVAVRCGDRSGFIVNALLFPYLNDAIKAHEAGLGTIDEIDEAIKEHYSYPMGPFALLDVVGLDVSLAIQEELKAEFGHEGFTPAPTLVELVEAGKLGRKTGEGFRTY